jgi:virulence-associated protein VapD
VEPRVHVNGQGSISIGNGEDRKSIDVGKTLNNVIRLISFSRVIKNVNLILANSASIR